MAAGDATVDLLLRRLEAEYHAVVAATRPSTSGATDHSGGEDDDIDAEAEGYAPLGACISDVSDNEDEDSGGDGDPYRQLGDRTIDECDAECRASDVCLADVGAVDTLPHSFIESALPSRAEYEASLALSDEERLVLEREMKRRILPCVWVAGGAELPGGMGTNITGEPKEAESRVLATQSMAWTAEFPEAEEMSMKETDVIRHAEPLPPGRADAIREAMAGMSLALPQPSWAGTVPESVWVHQLLNRDRRSSKSKSSSELTKRLAD